MTRRARNTFFLGRLAAVAPLAAVTAVTALATLQPACAYDEPKAADVCGEAKNLFASCGTSLPLLSDGPCAGTTRIVARCVVDHARDCDELATLFVRIDACVADLLDGGDSLLPPASDLPVPPRDAGGDGHDPGADGGGGADAAPRAPGGGSGGARDGGTGEAGTETRP